MTALKHTIDSVVFIMNIYLKQTGVQTHTRNIKHREVLVLIFHAYLNWYCSFIDGLIDLKLMGYDEEQALCLQHANKCSRTVIKDRQSHKPADLHDINDREAHTH